MHRSRTAAARRALGAAIAALVLSGVGVTAATAAPAGGGPAAPTLGVPEARAVDAARVARDNGVSREQARKEMDLGHVADGLLTAVRAIAGDRYAAAWAERAPAWRLHLTVTAGPAVPGLQRLVEAADLPVDLQYRDVPSEKHLVEEADRLAAWASTVPGVDGVAVDAKDGSLVLVVNEQSDLASRRTAPPTSLPVTVEHSAGRAGDTWRGGVATSTCTAGFSVRSSSSYGFVTAGHCGNTQSFSSTPTGSPTYATTYAGEIRGTTADLQLHRPTAGATSNTFFGSSATSATIRNGSGTGFVGQFLCHRGRTTGYSCGEVTSTAFAPTWSGACGSSACAAAFVRVQHPALQNQGGDSGGPWFYGAAAYGIHKGGGIDWGVYTPISRISSLGVSLL